MGNNESKEKLLEHSEAKLKLQKEGSLQVKLLDGKDASKSSFYVNYSNYKKGVTVKIKLN